MVNGRAAAEVSVVVPYYRAQQDLDRLVAALAAQEHPGSRLQLVLADDGSPEPPRVPAGLPFNVVTVRQEDRGFRASAARALGARAAEGRVLAFLDGDMLPEPGYLAAASAAPAVSPDAVVVGRRRHVAEALVESGWRPGESVPADALLEEPAWLREAYAVSGNLARADSTSYRFVISAVLTVAREVYEDAGGFDPGFVGYGGEDWELAHRLWRVGGVLRHEPAAVAWQAGGDFGAREDPREARRVKNREAMVLAPRISAPTARGVSLGLGAGAGSEPGLGAGSGRRHARVAATVEAGEAGEAAVVVGVDAVLQAFPAARAVVVGSRGEDAAACLADPRVRIVPDGTPVHRVPTPRPTDPRDLLRAAPDWDVHVLLPVRPAGRGERPDPRDVAERLLGLERDGVERVELLVGAVDDGGLREPGPTPDGAGQVPEGSVAVVLTSSRARWRVHRDPDAAVPTRRLTLSEAGWRPVEPDPDLEGWWGGWA